MRRMTDIVPVRPTGNGSFWEERTFVPVPESADFDPERPFAVGRIASLPWTPPIAGRSGDAAPIFAIAISAGLHRRYVRAQFLE